MEKKRIKRINVNIKKKVSINKKLVAYFKKRRIIPFDEKISIFLERIEFFHLKKNELVARVIKMVSRGLFNLHQNHLFQSVVAEILRKI